MSDPDARSKTRVKRSVTTPLHDIEHDAALAANLNPSESDVVDAKVTPEGELRLTLRGEEL